MIGTATRLAPIVAGLVLALTYLLLGGAAPDPAVHERRLAALDAVMLGQASLHRDVLRARAGMLRNYDPLVAAIAGLRRAARELEDGARTAALGVRHATLVAEIDTQEELVEEFKSSNALLHNSLAYFVHASPELAGRADDPALAAAGGELANAMLRFIAEPSREAGEAAAAALEQLARVPLQPALWAEAASLVAHGRLIVATLPAVDAPMTAMLAARTADEARAMQSLLVDDYRRAAERAWWSRVALYGVSLLLLAYLVYLYLALRATMRARERAAREREALEHRLQRAARMEALGRLAAGIAHDFNNVLGAILGYAELALAQLPPGARPWRHVREVGRAGRRGKAVVDQILAFGRPSEPRRRPVRLAAALDEVAALLRASQPAVAFELRVAPPDVAVLADPTQLQQVMLNLGTNAAHAMDQQGTVAIAAETADVPDVLSHGTLAPGRYVRVTVRDTGRGMDEATLERIFEPFFTTKPAGVGTGIGLATVHAIVAEHGGALDVRSAPGTGSSFAVYLPRADAAPDGAEGAATPSGHGETILVVDDGAVLAGREEMLAQLGYEPVGFASSALALAALREDPLRFDLMLADAEMLDVGGSALAGTVHALRPELPIVLITDGGPGDGAGVRRPGIAALVGRPPSAAVLAQVLARSLRPLQP